MRTTPEETQASEANAQAAPDQYGPDSFSTIGCTCSVQRTQSEAERPADMKGKFWTAKRSSVERPLHDGRGVGGEGHDECQNHSHAEINSSESLHPCGDSDAEDGEEITEENRKRTSRSCEPTKEILAKAKG